MNPSDKIAIYRSLFRGRDDVFARRWEKGARSGYAPAYSFSWDEFNAHRSKGGSLKDFENKELSPLTDDVIYKHLSGQMTVGIYPILPDNSSYFMAADFDHANWLDDCKSFRQEMAKIGLSAYIERSRSGNGGHVWIFFEAAYPCYKVRFIGLEIARKILHLSEFDKETSFDRLFPNQDTTSEGGFGNLIALPFQGESTKHGNTVFIDPNTDEPYEDQYSIIKSAKKHTPTELDYAYAKLTSRPISPMTSKNKKLQVVVSQNITLDKGQLNGALVGFLKEQLNFLNTEYLTKKRLGMSLHQVQKYFRFIEESDETVSLPRGFLSRLLRFLYENDIK